MATLIKRKSKYSVVYYVVDENGVKRQKWESFDSNAAARKRKAEIEHQQDTNTLIAPPPGPDAFRPVRSVRHHLWRQHLGTLYL